jgi:hypothetical protein
MPFSRGGRPSNKANQNPQPSKLSHAQHANPHARSPLQKEQDLAREMEMYVRGDTIYKIAQVIGVSQMQIHRDLKEIRQKWLDRMMRAADDHKAEELKKLDYLESEAYKAWERSQLDAEMVETTKRVSDALRGVAPLTKLPNTGKLAQPGKKKSEVTTVKTQGQYGDPRFLAIIRDCIAKRCDILGLSIPSEKTPFDAFKTQEDTLSLINQRIAQLRALPSAAPATNQGQQPANPTVIDIKPETVQ